MDARDSTAGSTRYSVFRLSDTYLAVNISVIKEVLSLTGFAPLPNVSPNLKGIFNLRGTLVTLIDIRSVIGLDHGAAADMEMVIVVELNGRLFGVLVDAVHDFIDVEDDNVKLPAESFPAGLASYTIGIIEKSDLGVVHLLDFKKLFDPRLIFGSSG